MKQIQMSNDISLLWCEPDRFQRDPSRNSQHACSETTQIMKHTKEKKYNRKHNRNYRRYSTLRFSLCKLVYQLERCISRRD